MWPHAVGGFLMTCRSTVQSRATVRRQTRRGAKAPASRADIRRDGRPASSPPTHRARGCALGCDVLHGPRFAAGEQPRHGGGSRARPARAVEAQAPPHCLHWGPAAPGGTAPAGSSRAPLGGQGQAGPKGATQESRRQARPSAGRGPGAGGPANRGPVHLPARVRGRPGHGPFRRGGAPPWNAGKRVHCPT
jgi:hypothetical protein